jgi:hypothetical protein
MKGRTMLRVAGREIDGELACTKVTTYSGSHRERWVEFELYALASGEWLIHRIGMSNVYHRPDTRCSTRGGWQSGDPAGIDQLPDDALPCVVCKPPYPQDLEDKPGVVRFEFPRHTWDKCLTPEQVKEKLTTARSASGSEASFMSAPVNELLRSAAINYPEFGPLVNPAA